MFRVGPHALPPTIRPIWRGFLNITTVLPDTVHFLPAGRNFLAAKR
jgi:hypothetical protein